MIFWGIVLILAAAFFSFSLGRLMKEIKEEKEAKAAVEQPAKPSPAPAAPILTPIPAPEPEANLFLKQKIKDLEKDLDHLQTLYEQDYPGLVGELKVANAQIEGLEKRMSQLERRPGFVWPKALRMNLVHYEGGKVARNKKPKIPPLPDSLVPKEK